MAYGLTNSAHLVKASSQSLTKASALGIATNITLEAWVKVNSQPATDTNQCIIVNRGGTAKRLFAISYGDAAGVKRLRFESNRDNVAGIYDYYNTTLTTGTWYHVALTFDGTTVIGYLNGSSVSSVSHTGVGSGTPAAYSGLGLHPFDGVNLDGDVSLGRVWSTALSGATILANYCNVYGTPTTNMRAEWSLDGVLTDSSGNAYTLTNNNSATFTATLPSTCSPVVTPSSPRRRYRHGFINFKEIWKQIKWLIKELAIR